MNLITSHTDIDINEMIMEWLYDYSEIRGTEEHLLGEKLTNVLGSTEIIKLEEYLSEWYQENITLPEDLIFIFYSAGTVENTGGAINKTSAKKHKAVKPEAHPISFAVGG